MQKLRTCIDFTESRLKKIGEHSFRINKKDPTDDYSMQMKKNLEKYQDDLIALGIIEDKEWICKKSNIIPTKN